MRSDTNETYNLKEPTNRSHPIALCSESELCVCGKVRKCKRDHILQTSGNYAGMYMSFNIKRHISTYFFLYDI